VTVGYKYNWLVVVVVADVLWVNNKSWVCCCILQSYKVYFVSAEILSVEITLPYVSSLIGESVVSSGG